MSRLALAFALTAALAPAAFATEYTHLQPEQSDIAFSYRQMGVSMDGRFRSVAATELSFDPARPEEARAVVEVALASIDTGSEENDAVVAGKDWLHSQAFPTARFELAGIEALGGDRYQATGTLSIKGTRRAVVAPATFSEQDGIGVLQGSFTLRRGDYAIGEGEWSAFDIVANDIQVSFRVSMAAGQ